MQKIIIVLLFAFFLRLPGLWNFHIENDEVIYQALVTKIAHNPLAYNLQGSTLPGAYSGAPLFHHPPIAFYAWALIQKVAGSKWLVMLPILCGVMTVWLIFMIGRRLYDENTALVAVGIFALCPISLHASTKIWLDAPLTMMCALTVWLAIKATDQRWLYLMPHNKWVKKQPDYKAPRKPDVACRWYALTGLSLGLAIMTKLSAIAIIPAIAYVFIKGRVKPLALAATVVTALAVVAPWVFVFWQTYHSLNPMAALIGGSQNTEFTRIVAARPAWYYLTNLIAVAPVYIFGLLMPWKRENRVLMIWVLSVFALFILAKNTGAPVIMRYILPTLPALALLTAAWLKGKPQWVLVVVGGLCAYGLCVGIVNSYVIPSADVFNLAFCWGSR